MKLHGPEYVEELLKHVTVFPNWTLRYDKSGYGSWYLRIIVKTTDATKKASGNLDIIQISYLYGDMQLTHEAWLHWLETRFKDIYMHEFLEFFQYDGKPVHDPHPELHDKRVIL